MDDVTRPGAADGGAPVPDFRPASWASGPHAQTLVARVLRSPRGPELTRERLETPDGDFIDVDWGADVDPETPIALVLHGLEGSSRRPYVRSVCRELTRRGVRPVAMNFRGCSGEPNRALHFYHSGDTADAAWLLAQIRERHPGRAVGAMGFSLGGNVLLKLMGERADGGRALVDAAAVMSVPYDLAAGSALLERSTMGRLYARYFLRSLRRKVSKKRERLEAVVDYQAAEGASTLWRFDDLVTAPVNGFDSARDYYERCSSRRYLATIAVPTLMLHARDDPFLPPEAIPIEIALANPRLSLLLWSKGGHVGFLEGAPWRPRFRGDEVVADFLATRLRGRGAGTGPAR